MSGLVKEKNCVINSPGSSNADTNITIGGVNYQRFTTTGSTRTWSKPLGVTVVYMEAIGGGGAGAGGANAGGRGSGGGGGGTKPSGAGMGGGGAGGYKYVTGFGVTAQKYEVKVGQGGSGGNFKNDVFGSEGSSGYYCQGRNGDESAIYPTNGTYNYNPLTGGIYDNYTGSADSDILTRNNTSYGRN